MKKISLLLLVCGISIAAKAQQNSVSAGGDATGSGGSVSYSIGQVSYIAAFDGVYSVSEGVQQPYEISVLTSLEDATTDISFNIYPNPTVSGVNITASENTGAMSFQLFDVNGKLIVQEQINSLNTTVNMDKLASGAYFLHVLTENKTYKTFKIIKNK